MEYKQIATSMRYLAHLKYRPGADDEAKRVLWPEELALEEDFRPGLAPEVQVLLSSFLDVSNEDDEGYSRPPGAAAADTTIIGEELLYYPLSSEAIRETLVVLRSLQSRVTPMQDKDENIERLRETHLREQQPSKLSTVDWTVSEDIAVKVVVNSTNYSRKVESFSSRAIHYYGAQAEMIANTK